MFVLIKLKGESHINTNNWIIDYDALAHAN